MKFPNSSTIRVSRETHEILRYMSYKQNRRITDIIDEAFKDKGPSVSEKVENALNKLTNNN